MEEDNKNSGRRYSLLYKFSIGFIILSFLLRIVFFIWQYHDASFAFTDFFKTLFTGLFYDTGVLSFILLAPVIYIALLPGKLIGSVFDKAVTYVFFSITLLIVIFTFFAEITFWDEFSTRFNFIAVDYLIYTHEVISNINESYPLPLLIGGVILLEAGIIYFLIKQKTFIHTFHSNVSIKSRAAVTLATVTVCVLFLNFVNNEDAEWSSNQYNNEISKAGIYSFFAAFRNNRLKYDEFYTSIDEKKAFAIVREKLKCSHASYDSDGLSIKRNIASENDLQQHPNVVFILMESMSASFMERFGNEDNITPNLDKLANNSMFFNNLYATGTRTVRGMEAVTLCIPPTPGQSIVKRPDNHNLYTVSNVFEDEGYANSFFYGGDGYFDNMNSYFGGNGFELYDRGHGSVLSDNISVPRHHIDDKEVTFENAWGICDEDIFKKMIQVADEKYKSGKPFFNFVMTTSNHRPYTYPEGKIDIPSGKNRNGAVKYADYAIGKMIQQAKTKPWFSNTVFVIVADHCASSAGKDEIDIEKHHIPAFIYNLPGGDNNVINKQCSQIDLFPTLFANLGWNYQSNFYGENVNENTYDERAYVATYRKLGLLKKDDLVILSDQKKQKEYKYDKRHDALRPAKINNELLNETVSMYETADYQFSNGLLKR